LQNHPRLHISRTRIHRLQNQLMMLQQMHLEQRILASQHGTRMELTYDLISRVNSSAMHAQSLSISWSKFCVRLYPAKRDGERPGCRRRCGSHLGTNRPTRNSRVSYSLDARHLPLQHFPCSISTSKCVEPMVFCIDWQTL